MDALISVKSLWSVMTQREYRDYCSGMTKGGISKSLQQICVDKVYEGNYRFNLKIIENVVMNNHPRKSLEYLCQNLLIRNLNKNILKAYRLQSANRNVISRQLLQLLNKNVQFNILRKDVRHFFESIQPSKVMEQLKEEGRITIQTIDLLDGLLNETSRLGAQGLPRGLSISSGLSEYFMRKYDYEFIRLEGLLYYCRFVDDMLFVSSSVLDVNDIQEKVNQALGCLEIQENEEKKQSLTSDDLKGGKPFDFLGYQFKFVDNAIKVDIAVNKINKIKTRMVIAFKQYVVNKKSDLLYERMRYLTCICTICGPNLRKIKIGIPANYFAINIYVGLKDLDGFYRRLLYCKRGKFGLKLQSLLVENWDLRKRLERISFTNSFERKRKFKVSPKRIHDITECWR